MCPVDMFHRYTFYDMIIYYVNVLLGSCPKRSFVLEEAAYNSAQPFSHVGYQPLILKVEE